MRIGPEWEAFAVSPKEVLDAGDTVIGHGYYSGTYRKTGKQARAQFAYFFTFRDGKIVKFQQCYFVDRPYILAQLTTGIFETWGRSLPAI